MTTQAERELYYALTLEAAGSGAVVELGAWMGASTAYIAAGLRDAGADKKSRAYIYDRWQWKPAAHREKNGGDLTELTLYREFKKNLGPLLEYVKPRQGEIAAIKWNEGPVALLIADAPKRVQEISHVLATFADALSPGAVIVWQDFAHFPSYQIPACLYRLRDKLELASTASEGTTAAFKIKEPWSAADVSTDRLALARWAPAEVKAAWLEWAEMLPMPWRARFWCGAAMFLEDIGAHESAAELLLGVVKESPDEVLPKWRYLRRTHKNVSWRYRRLFRALQGGGYL